MGLNKNNRMTVSLSEVGDRDLIEVLQKVDYDFSRFVRELLRDGLKYRGLGDSVGRVVNQNTTPPTTQVEKKNSRKSKTSNPPKEPQVVKKDIKKHVEDKLDSKL